MTIFSNNLKALRAKKGYKQAEIADSIGVTVSTWSNYEVGKSEPNLEILIRNFVFFWNIDRCSFIRRRHPAG